MIWLSVITIGTLERRFKHGLIHRVIWNRKISGEYKYTEMMTKSNGAEHFRPFFSSSFSAILANRTTTTWQQKKPDGGKFIRHASSFTGFFPFSFTTLFYPAVGVLLMNHISQPYAFFPPVLVLLLLFFARSLIPATIIRSIQSIRSNRLLLCCSFEISIVY